MCCACVLVRPNRRGLRREETECVGVGGDFEKVIRGEIRGRFQLIAVSWMFSVLVVIRIIVNCLILAVK